MANWTEIANQIWWGNSLLSWALAALAFLLAFTLLPLLRRYFGARRDRLGIDGPAAIALIAYLLQHTSRLVRWLVALFAAERILTLPTRVDRAFEIAIVVGFWLQVGLWMAAAVRFGLERQQRRSGNVPLAGTIGIVLFVARLLIAIIVVLLALDNLGVHVTTLVAGLGVGGIALALAVQTVLSDLFASMSIALDRPFSVGDHLRVDDYEGVVEQIGIKSTRMRSVTGEQIIIANTDLLKSRVRNLGRMSEQRALFTLRLTYDTAADKLERVSQLVAEAVSSYAGARFVYCLLKELGESALRFEVCFFVENSAGHNPNVALDVVNRRILHSFAAAGVEFAYPTRSVLLRERQAASEPPQIQS
jgi:small-conductance mechanosensitive channel